jgi:hypothetical protein
MKLYNVFLLFVLSQFLCLISFLKRLAQTYRQSPSKPPLQVSQNEFLYSLQNDYNCLIVWQIDLHVYLLLYLLFLTLFPS